MAQTLTSERRIADADADDAAAAAAEDLDLDVNVDVEELGSVQIAPARPAQLPIRDTDTERERDAYKERAAI